MKNIHIAYLAFVFVTGNAFADPTPATAPAVAPKPAEFIVRISAIDGKVNPNHKKEIQRRATKKVTFAADLFVKENGKLMAQKASPQDFVWNLSNLTDVCDPTRLASCKYTEIKPTKDGVTVQLSQELFNSIRIQINEKDEPLTLKVMYAKNKKKSDSIIIQNLDDIESDAESRKAAEEMGKSVGIGGFFSGLFGGGSSSSSSDDDDSSYERMKADMAREDRQRNLRELDKVNPGLAYELRKIDREKHEALRESRELYEGSSYRNNYGNGGDHNYGGHNNFGRRDHDGGGRPDWRNRSGGNYQPAAPAAPAAPAWQGRGRDHDGQRGGDLSDGMRQQRESARQVEQNAAAQAAVIAQQAQAGQQAQYQAVLQARLAAAQQGAAAQALAAQVGAGGREGLGGLIGAPPAR